MKKISSTAANVPPSEIRKMFAMQEGMDDVVSFALGEPDFDVPEKIVSAIIDSYGRKETHYTNNLGLVELRKSISKKYKKNKMEYGIDEIIVTPGAISALNLVAQLIMEPGDEIIIPDPCWSNYMGLIAERGAKSVPVLIKESNNFMFDLQDIKKAITDKTKAIIINSPSNPTGGVLDKDNVLGIAKIARDNDLFIISDEIYQEFLWLNSEYCHIASLPGMKERTFVIDGFSKSYAMTGLRLGFVAAPKEYTKIMNLLLENIFSCVNESIQWGGYTALEGVTDDVERMREIYKKRQKIIVDGLNSIDKIVCPKPGGAFYVFPNIKKTGLSSTEFAIRLLKSKHVVVVPGSGFGAGGEGYIRLSYATSKENIVEGLQRIKEFVDEL